MIAVRLTLVCAVYKVREFLPALIDSLVAGANDPEVKVVFVDDCSPDDSLAVCRAQLARRGDEIAFKHEIVERAANGGLSAARNSGLAAAEGDYVGYIDSDDLVAPGYYAALAPQLRSGPWDIVEFGLAEFTDVAPADTFSSRCEPFEVDQLSPFRNGFFAWARVYRRELVVDLAFPVGRLYEDVHYVLRAYGRATRILRLEAPLVHYRKRAGSITARRDRRYAEQLASLVDGLQDALPGLQQPRRAFAAAVRKAGVILLKGLRIAGGEERLLFLRACREPLRRLAALGRAATMPVSARAQLAGCRSLLWLAGGSA